MNNSLNDFLLYREKCPCCSNPLIFETLSLNQVYAQDSYDYSNNTVSINDQFTEWKMSRRSKTWNFRYVINKNDNTFSIEFLSATGEPVDQISIDTAKNFLHTHCVYTDLKNNERKLKPKMKFQKSCLFCQRYFYYSYPVFDCKKSLYSLEITEVIDLQKVHEVSSNYYRVAINYPQDCTYIFFDKKKFLQIEENNFNFSQNIKLPAIDIDFSSPEKVLKKVEMLLLFS